jgi:hypothetical protein
LHRRLHDGQPECRAVLGQRRAAEHGQDPARSCYRRRAGRGKNTAHRCEYVDRALDINRSESVSNRKINLSM